MQIKKYFAIDKKRCQTAFLSAVIIGLLVHFYRFTNLLPNHDAIWNFYSSQNMLKSGRWFLGIACGLSTYFDLPWVIGLVSLVYMGVTAAVIAEIFQMRSPFVIGLCSGLLVSFPAITATMGYEFTADGYMLAMALAALSVYLSRFVYLDGKQSLPFALSGVCLCLTMAIYQAYVCFAFVLALCYCIVELLENRWDNKHLLKWIFIQIAVYICAFIAYSVIWEALLAIQGVEKVHYNGIDELGFVGFGGILRALWSILYADGVFKNPVRCHRNQHPHSFAGRWHNQVCGFLWEAGPLGGKKSILPCGDCPDVRYNAPGPQYAVPLFPADIHGFQPELVSKQRS